MKNNLSHFFADMLRKRDLTEEDELTLQRMLFPGYDANPNKAAIESAHDMTLAYEQWERQQGGQDKQDKTQDAHPEPMTDAEVEALAELIY